MPGVREVARRFTLRIRTQAVLLSVVPLTFLIALCVIASVLQTRTEQTATWSQRSTNALDEADAIQKLLTSGNRSAVDFTRQPKAGAAVLAPYHLAQREIPVHARRLQELVRDEPEQRARAARYASLSNTLIETLTTYMTYWQAGQKAKAQAMVTNPRVRKNNYAWQLARDEFDDSERALTLTRYAEIGRAHV